METIKVKSIELIYEPLTSKYHDWLGQWLAHLTVEFEQRGKRGYYARLPIFPDRLNEGNYDWEGMSKAICDKFCEKVQERYGYQAFDLSQFRTVFCEKGPMILQHARDLKPYFEEIK